MFVPSSSSWMNRLSIKRFKRLIGHLLKVHWNAQTFHKVPRQSKKKSLENHLGKWKVRQVLGCLFHALSNSETRVTVSIITFRTSDFQKHREVLKEVFKLSRIARYQHVISAPCRLAKTHPVVCLASYLVTQLESFLVYKLKLLWFSCRCDNKHGRAT